MAAGIRIATIGKYGIEDGEVGLQMPQNVAAGTEAHRGSIGMARMIGTMMIDTMITGIMMIGTVSGEMTMSALAPGLAGTRRTTSDSRTLCSMSLNNSTNSRRTSAS